MGHSKLGKLISSYGFYCGKKLEEIKGFEKDASEKEKVWGKYEIILLMDIKRIRVKRSKYENV